MAVYAVTAIRLNATQTHVERVLWGEVNAQTKRWVARGNAEAPTIDVIDAINSGNSVYALFPLEGRTIVGPKLKVVVCRGGRESIEIENARDHRTETVRYLPRF